MLNFAIFFLRSLRSFHDFSPRVYFQRPAEEYVECAVYFLSLFSPSRLYFENYQEKKNIFIPFRFAPIFCYVLTHSVLYIHMHICNLYVYYIYLGTFAFSDMCSAFVT